MMTPTISPSTNTRAISLASSFIERLDLVKIYWDAVVIKQAFQVRNATLQLFNMIGRFIKVVLVEGPQQLGNRF